LLFATTVVLATLARQPASEFGRPPAPRRERVLEGVA